MRLNDSRIEYIVDEICSLRASVRLTTPRRAWDTLLAERSIRVAHVDRITTESLLADALIVETLPDRPRASWITALKSRDVPLAFIEFRFIDFDELEHDDREGVTKTLMCGYAAVACSIAIIDATDVSTMAGAPEGELHGRYVRGLFERAVDEVLVVARGMAEKHAPSAAEQRQATRIRHENLSRARDRARVALETYRSDARSVVAAASNIEDLRNALRALDEDLTARIAIMLAEVGIKPPARPASGSIVDNAAPRVLPVWLERLRAQDVLVDAGTSFVVDSFGLLVRRGLTLIPDLFAGSRVRREDADQLSLAFDVDVREAIRQVERQFDRAFAQPARQSDAERTLGLIVGRARKLKGLLAA